MISLCAFCMKNHAKNRPPKICTAKRDVMRTYLDEGLQFFQVMQGIECGIIKLEAEALQLIRMKREK